VLVNFLCCGIRKLAARREKRKDGGAEGRQREREIAAAGKVAKTRKLSMLINKIFSLLVTAYFLSAKLGRREGV